MIIAGFDPSLVAFGYAAFEQDRGLNMLTGCGAWETWAETEVIGATRDTAERFLFIANELWKFVDRLKPEIIYVEGIVYMRQTNFAAISTAGRAHGMVELAGAALGGVQVVELTPQAVKKGLGIVRTKTDKDATPMASKKEVVDAVLALYPNAGELLPKNKAPREGAADAVAIAHVGLLQSAYLDRVSSGSSR